MLYEANSFKNECYICRYSICFALEISAHLQNEIFPACLPRNLATSANKIRRCTVSGKAFRRITSWHTYMYTFKLIYEIVEHYCFGNDPRTGATDLANSVRSGYTHLARGMLGLLQHLIGYF